MHKVAAFLALHVFLALRALVYMIILPLTSTALGAGAPRQRAGEALGSLCQSRRPARASWVLGQARHPRCAPASAGTSTQGCRGEAHGYGVLTVHTLSSV